MSDQTIIVAGLGRCGTSMVMQMLGAAGLPTIGTYPDFEDGENYHLLEDDIDGWRSSIEGKVVKLIDAHRFSLPPLYDTKVIWLDRDKKQQAASQLKLLNSAFSMISDNRETRRGMQSGLERDTPAAIRSLRRAGAVVYRYNFEAILARPLLMAERIGSKFGADDEAIDRMAEVIIQRPPECLPYMLEFDLIDAGRAAA